jgi:hypothetical protein
MSSVLLGEAEAALSSGKLAGEAALEAPHDLLGGPAAESQNGQLGVVAAIPWRVEAPVIRIQFGPVAPFFVGLVNELKH